MPDVDQLFTSDRELGEVLEEVAHLGVRLLMQTALEAEVAEFLGRELPSVATGPVQAAGMVTVPPPSRPPRAPSPWSARSSESTDEAFASRLLGTGAADFRNSPLLITEIPRLVGGVG